MTKNEVSKHLGKNHSASECFGVWFHVYSFAWDKRTKNACLFFLPFFLSHDDFECFAALRLHSLCCTYSSPNTFPHVSPGHVFSHTMLFPGWHFSLDDMFPRMMRFSGWHISPDDVFFQICFPGSLTSLNSMFAHMMHFSGWHIPLVTHVSLNMFSYLTCFVFSCSTLWNISTGFSYI